MEYREERYFMKKILFKGCGTAIATPFDENGVNVKEFIMEQME